MEVGALSVKLAEGGAAVHVLVRDELRPHYADAHGRRTHRGLAAAHRVGWSSTYCVENLRPLFTARGWRHLGLDVGHFVPLHWLSQFAVFTSKPVPKAQPTGKY